MGDVLWIEPVIRVMASKHRRLTVVTKYNELFLHYPLPNVRFRSSLSFRGKVLAQLDKLFRTRLFSVILDDAYEQNPHIHFLEAYQEKAGIPLRREYPRLYLSPAETGVTVPGRLVILHLESMTDKNYRMVYGVDWAAVAAHLRGLGYTVIQLGKQPVPIPGVEQKATGIRDMIALMAKASFFIGLDSGPSHIATALGVPALLFFGAVNPAYRHFPELMKGTILQQPCPYAGCYHEDSHPETMVCRLVGKEGVPVCCLHTTEGVIEAIGELRQKYLC